MALGTRSKLRFTAAEVSDRTISHLSRIFLVQGFQQNGGRAILGAVPYRLLPTALKMRHEWMSA